MPPFCALPPTPPRIVPSRTSERVHRLPPAAAPLVRRAMNVEDRAAGLHHESTWHHLLPVATCDLATALEPFTPLLAREAPLSWLGAKPVPRARHPDDSDTQLSGTCSDSECEHAGCSTAGNVLAMHCNSVRRTWSMRTKRIDLSCPHHAKSLVSLRHTWCQSSSQL